MKVLKKSVLSTTLLMLSSFGFVPSASGINLEAEIQDISQVTATESDSGLSFTTETDLEDSTLNGVGAIELFLCNNYHAGYIVSAASSRGGHLQIAGLSSDYAKVDYTLQCEDASTISNVEVPASESTDLSSSGTLFDYNGAGGATCYTTTCTIAANAGEDIGSKYGGTYTDTLTVSIANK